jgi:hypothetical protein
VLSARERTTILSFVVFIFKFAFESFKECGGTLTPKISMNSHYNYHSRYFFLEGVLIFPSIFKFDSNWSLERLNEVTFLHGTKKLDFW